MGLADEIGKVESACRNEAQYRLAVMLFCPPTLMGFVRGTSAGMGTDHGDAGSMDLFVIIDGEIGISCASEKRNSAEFRHNVKGAVKGGAVARYFNASIYHSAVGNAANVFNEIVFCGIEGKVGTVFECKLAAVGVRICRNYGVCTRKLLEHNRHLTQNAKAYRHCRFAHFKVCLANTCKGEGGYVAKSRILERNVVGDLCHVVALVNFTFGVDAPAEGNSVADLQICDIFSYLFNNTRAAVTEKTGVVGRHIYLISARNVGVPHKICAFCAAAYGGNVFANDNVILVCGDIKLAVDVFGNSGSGECNSLDFHKKPPKRSACFYINALTASKKYAILHKKITILQKEVKKIKNIEGFCLTHFDILILEAENGRINRIQLGAAWNYFGTLIGGSARFVSEDVDITIREGESVFIPKGCVYRSEWHGEPTARFYSLPFVFANQENNIRFSLQKIEDLNIFDDMEKIYHLKSEGSLCAFSSFYALFDKVCAHLETKKEKIAKNSIYPAAKYIDEHCDASFDVPFLAAMCNMSESGFYAHFKEQTGTTPIEYKNRQRCIKAAELLRSTDYTIEYISEKLNFSSPMYLRKVLFAFFGKTPREIRKEKKEVL